MEGGWREKETDEEKIHCGQPVCTQSEPLAGVGVWILGWNLSEGGAPTSREYAPIMFIVDTIVMCAGMWSCAALIGQTTQELSYEHWKGFGEESSRLV
jgi:hypothetical protein